MKHFIACAIITFSLLITTGCKTTQNAPAQTPTSQSAAETPDSQQPQDVSTVPEEDDLEEDDTEASSFEMKAPEDWTPLMEAAKQGNLEEVKKLIASNADVNAKMKVGWTALKIATSEMNADIVEALISAGANVNEQKGETSALMIAAIGGRKRRGLGFPSASMKANSIVQMLLSAHADVNAFDGDGATVLHYAVLGGDPEIVKTLISAGADVNAVTNNHETALMMAASCESLFCTNLETNVQLVQVLLQAKVAVNAQDKEGNTALHYVAFAEYDERHPDHATYIAKSLLDAGANPKLKNNKGESAEAFVAGLKVKPLPKTRPVDPQSATLMRALWYRDFETASDLLKAGVDVNAQNSFGETLLMQAIVNSFMMGDLNNEGIEIAESLIASGANVNATDFNGTTALMLASERLIPNLVMELLKAGADAKAKDNEGRTALDRFEQGKTTFFRFTYDQRDVFYKDGMIALTRIDHEKIHDLLQDAMK